MSNRSDPFLAAIDAFIAKTEAQLHGENDYIKGCIAGKQIGDGYWRRQHELQEIIKSAIALREAIIEE